MELYGDGRTDSRGHKRCGRRARALDMSSQRQKFDGNQQHFEFDKSSNVHGRGSGRYMLARGKCVPADPREVLLIRGGRQLLSDNPPSRWVRCEFEAP